METLCSSCGERMDVSEGAIEAAEKHANGKIRCTECEGVCEYATDVAECDYAGCKSRGPFEIHTEMGSIWRCRDHLLHDLTEKEWFQFKEVESA